MRHNPVKLTGKGFFCKLSDIDKGIGDLICCHKGKYFEIEVKTMMGVQSEFQKLHQMVVERNGGIYILVRSLGEAMAQLKEKGITL